MEADLQGRYANRGLRALVSRLNPIHQAHRGRTFVVVLSGEALLHGNLVNIVHDLALLNVLGARLVLVHGARPQLDAALPDSTFHTHQGVSRRITDAAAMDAVAGVHGQLRTELEALFSTGLPATPLHNTEIQLTAGNFITARPIGVLDGVDHELTGRPRRIRADGINRALGTGAIVLLAPIGYSPSGQAFNLATDELAELVAVALQADKLVAFDELPYLAGADGERLGNLSPGELDEFLQASPVGEHTRRNLRSLLGAVRGGVKSGQLVSYSDDGALLAELFTAEGVGTQITEEDRRVVRQAEPGDVADIVEIIRPLEESGVLVKRSRDRLEREIGRFLVAEVDGIVAGCCALYPAGQGMELACMAVHPAYRGGAPGTGAKLLATAEDAARAGGCSHLFVLTTQARDWFLENGFHEAENEDRQAARKTLYSVERNSKLLVKTLAPSRPPPEEVREHG